MKVLNDLYDYGLKIYQDEQNFKFSLDTILLAESVELKKNDKVLDFCTGSAPVPLILSTKYSNKIVGVEIQRQVYDLAKESVSYNGLSDQIELINDNLLNIKNYFPGNNFDVITCNPPYFKVSNSSLINDCEIKAISRHEITVSLKEIVETVNFMLKNNGAFYIVHRSERLQELINELSTNKLFVKNIYFIKTNDTNDVNLVLIKAVKNGRYGTKVKVIETLRKESYKNIFFE